MGTSLNLAWLLIAAVLFTLQPYVARRLAKASRAPETPASGAVSIQPRSLAGVMLLQLLISIYGGYFGAGIGVRCESLYYDIEG